jgi:hypothetical protein
MYREEYMDVCTLHFKKLLNAESDQNFLLWFCNLYAQGFISQGNLLQIMAYCTFVYFFPQPPFWVLIYKVNALF